MDLVPLVKINANFSSYDGHGTRNKIAWSLKISRVSEIHFTCEYNADSLCFMLPVVAVSKADRTSRPDGMTSRLTVKTSPDRTLMQNARAALDRRIQLTTTGE